MRAVEGAAGRLRAVGHGPEVAEGGPLHRRQVGQRADDEADVDGAGRDEPGRVDDGDGAAGRGRADGAALAPDTEDVAEHADVVGVLHLQGEPRRDEPGAALVDRAQLFGVPGGEVVAGDDEPDPFRVEPGPAVQAGVEPGLDRGAGRGLHGERGATGQPERRAPQVVRHVGELRAEVEGAQRGGVGRPALVLDGNDAAGPGSQRGGEARGSGADRADDAESCHVHGHLSCASRTGRPGRAPSGRSAPHRSGRPRRAGPWPS